MLDVTIVFLEGSHASTAIGPLEVFHDAGRLWNQLLGESERPAFRVRSASIGGRPVRGEGPYAIAADEALDRIGRTDLVFVPAAGLDLDEVMERNREVIEFLVPAYESGARIAGVCSGVSLLAASGLLDGRIATTHWGVVEEYRQRFGAVDWRPDSLVTEDGGIYTGGGVHAAFDLAIYLVDKLCGRDIALQCSRSLLIDMPRDCQAGFAVLPVGARHEDEEIRRAEDFIRRNCRQGIRFESLSRSLGMSPRNFVRRFKAATGLAPVEYLQRLRVRAARRMLEDGGTSVQEVGAAVGYEDIAFFRNVFKRHTGLAPAAYKKRFGAARGAS